MARYRQVWKDDLGLNQYGRALDILEGPCGVCIGSLRTMPQLTIYELEHGAPVHSGDDITGTLVFEGPLEEAIEIFKAYEAML